MSLAEELRAIVKGKVDASRETLDADSRDASLFRVEPKVVVTPEDAADVEAVVAYAAKEKAAGKDVSVTARSAGTDMSGGPLNNSIILDMKGMNRLLEVGDGFAVVEPGMYFRDFDKETQKKNLELPSYTASREINTVGGMAANNSGGEKNLKYGKTARYVEALDVVLSDGKVHTLKNLEGEALQKKLAEKSFEGDLYRAVAQMLADNVETVKEATPIVSKNSSGYALWDIGDGKKNLNLARLMVGAQGTLGIITKIRYKLVHPQPYSAMVVIFVKSLDDLKQLVPAGLKHEPDSFESFDDKTFSLAIKYFPEYAAQMKTGIISLGLSLIPEMWMLVTGGLPKLILMVEFCAATQEAAFAKAQSFRDDVAQLGLHDKLELLPNARASKKYWIIRRESFNLLRKKVRGMRTAPFIDDFVVPPLTLPEFLPKLSEILSHYDLTYTIAGHVGDGNFHIIPLVNPKRPDLPKIIDTLSHQVYDLVISFHGSISGEHNDGLVRTPYVAQMFGAKMEALFQETKKLFDPLDIFNPGKKVGTTFAEAEQHLDLPK